jgi:hypothetical protein
MSNHHKLTPDVTRVLIACSPSYANRGALQRALASIFLDNIEAQREYYYYPCPALTEIFDDRVLGGTLFHELVHGANDAATSLADIHFTHIMADRDDDFLQKLIDDIHAPHVTLIRLD